MQILSERGAAITTMDEWFDHAPPKGGRDHWVDRRSAKELARAWCVDAPPCVPPELRSLLASHPDLAGLGLEQAWPEKKVRFDSVRGEPRNTDLAILETLPDGRKVAVSVEAKADEPFDAFVLDRLVSAAKKMALEVNTGFFTRLQGLRDSLLSPIRDGDTPIGELRYQLLTATAGALSFALDTGASIAVLAVHEFLPPGGTLASKENANDLECFVSRLTLGRVRHLESGQLVGPFHVPGSKRIPKDIPLFVGKAIRTLP